ncbi:MAG: hypothetical protein ACJ74W_14760 [Pyrinomonadaceae bacterium]
MNKRIILSSALVWLLIASTGTLAQRGAARRKSPPKGAICGDPMVMCKTSAQFEPYDLPFRIPARAVIWESESFYAVVLKSVLTKDCEKFMSEAERQQAQALFPHNKVFTSRCPEAGFIYYTGVKPDTHLMAVYAGRTRAEAENVLAQVKATGKFTGANLRRMSIGFNGT